MAKGLISIDIINKLLFKKIFKENAIARTADRVKQSLPRMLDATSDDVVEKLIKETKDRDVKMGWRKRVVNDKEVEIYNASKKAAVVEYGNLSASPQSPLRNVLNEDPLDRKAIAKKLAGIFKEEIK